MYGDEELGLPPTKLYIEPYARKAVDGGRFVYEYLRKLVDEFMKYRKEVGAEKS